MAPERIEEGLAFILPPPCKNIQLLWGAFALFVLFYVNAMLTSAYLQIYCTSMFLFCPPKTRMHFLEALTRL